jgi:ABC-type sugar transport system permease subunit
MALQDSTTQATVVKPPAAGQARGAPGRRRAAVTWREIRRSWQAYALLAPVFAALIVFVYYPPILGLFRAFYAWEPTKEPVFVGLQNFRTYFEDPELVRGLQNVGLLLVHAAVAHVAMPFVMAELIFAVRSRLVKEIYRFLIVIPLVVPTVVYILLWGHIYDPNVGPVNPLLRSVGLGALARNWLGDPATALYAIMGVGFPWVAGVGTLIFLGGLGQISASVFDACRLDGSTGVRRALEIDLPLVMGQVRLLTILAVVGALTSFETILVLTRGGPGYATSVPGLTMFERAFTTGQFGLASAIGLLLFVLAIGLTVGINRVLRPYSEGS